MNVYEQLAQLAMDKDPLRVEIDPVVSNDYVDVGLIMYDMDYTSVEFYRVDTEGYALINKTNYTGEKVREWLR